MASSTKQKVSMNVILGLSHQFIHMRQSGFNADQKSTRLIIRRVKPFLASVNSHKCYFLWIISLSYITLMLYLIYDRLYSCHVTQGMGDIFLPQRGFFVHNSDTDSPFVGANDIGKESAYTCKL